MRISSWNFVHVISAIVYFRDIILESSRNVSETIPRASSPIILTLSLNKNTQLLHTGFACLVGIKFIGSLTYAQQLKLNRESQVLHFKRTYVFPRSLFYFCHLYLHVEQWVEEVYNKWGLRALLFSWKYNVSASTSKQMIFIGWSCPMWWKKYLQKTVRLLEVKWLLKVIVLDKVFIFLIVQQRHNLAN